MKIIVLVACNNRKHLTLRVLDLINKQTLPAGSFLDICLVDDGSTDNTASAVRYQFPDVTIVEGTGDLFWAGGMRYGWDAYVKFQTFDYLLVINDDIVVYLEALSTLLSSAASLRSMGVDCFAISGAFFDPSTGKVSYGGLKPSSRWHPLKFSFIEPSGVLQRCSTVNMNFTLISDTAAHRADFLTPEFGHKGADFDFGLRLARMGGFVCMSENFVGECSRNTNQGSVREKGVSVATRCFRFFSPKGGGHPQFRNLYYKRHAGRFWRLYLCLSYFESAFKAVRFIFSRKAVREAPVTQNDY